MAKVLMLHTPNDINSGKAPRDRVDPILALYQKGNLQDTLTQIEKAQDLARECVNNKFQRG